MEAPVKPKEEKMYGKYDKWEIENCADTIIKAEEIKADAGKMKYIKPILEKKMAGVKKAIGSLAELKEVAQVKGGAPDKEDDEYE
jgi:hypothetical protein